MELTMSIYPVEDLKIIKELLDEGIISFEEFTFLQAITMNSLISMIS